MTNLHSGARSCLSISGGKTKDNKDKKCGVVIGTILWTCPMSLDEEAMLTPMSFDRVSHMHL